MFTTPRSHSCANVFLTADGYDVVLVNDHGHQYRGRAPYSTGSTTIAGALVTVELVDDDHVHLIVGKKYDLELLRQPKGHYFAPLRDQVAESPRIDAAKARELIAAARAAA